MQVGIALTERRCRIPQVVMLAIALGGATALGQGAWQTSSTPSRPQPGAAAVRPPARPRGAPTRGATPAKLHRPLPARSQGAPTRGAATAALYESPAAPIWAPAAHDFGPRYGEIDPDLYCQTLDAGLHPLSYATLTYVPDASFGTFGDSSTLEFDSALRLFALEEFVNGYLEGFVRLRVLGYLNDTDIAVLPNAAVQAAFEIAPSWRFVNGWSLELRAAPGIYSDIVAPRFNCPTTLNMHYAVTPEFALVLGATVRPGWFVPVVPNVGIAWEPADFLRIEVMSPRSRALLALSDRLTLFGAVEWRNFDYGLEEAPTAPEAITVNEVTATAGAMLRLTEHQRLSVECGAFLLREISADVAAQATLDVGKAPLLRIGWHGAF